MSFSDILNKLAEKKALQGDSDFAYRLISASEKEEEKEEIKAEMIKRGKDHKKVASEEFWNEAREDLLRMLIPKFTEHGWFGEKEAKKAAEQYLENNSHLIDERAVRAIDRAMMMHGDAYASSLSKMIKKYAGENKKGSYEDAIKDLPGFTGMFGTGFCFMNKEQAQKALAIGEQAANFLDWAVERHDDGYMAIYRGRDKKSSALDRMIKKYAEEDGDLYPSKFDKAVGLGFDAANENPEKQLNPYSDDEKLAEAFEDGVRYALEMLQQKGTKL